MKDMFGRNLEIGDTIVYTVRGGSYMALKAGRIMAITHKGIKICSFVDFWGYDHVYITNLTERRYVVRCDLPDNVNAAMSAFLAKRKGK